MSDLNFLKLMHAESSYYRDLEQILENSPTPSTITNLPVLPLYQLIKDAPSDVSLQALSLLSPDQRTILWDLDLWQRDEVAVNDFEYWITLIGQSEDEALIFEFVQSPQFMLYFKSRLTWHTFDVEEPEYPDHDYYFLTKDSLLLVEYDEDFECLNECRKFIDLLYGTLGVENAYAFLFKYLVDGQMELSEQEYAFKRERLKEYGLPDYLEALNILSPYPSLLMASNSIAKRDRPEKSFSIDDYLKHQTLPPILTEKLQSDWPCAIEEIQKISDKKREDFLKFNLIQLVNAGLVAGDTLKKGSLASNMAIKRVKFYINLGVDLIRASKPGLGHSVFELFDFIETYKIGLTYINQYRTKLEKVLASSKTQFDKGFIGGITFDFIETLTQVGSTAYFDFKTKKKVTLENSSDFDIWKSQMLFVKELVELSSKIYVDYNQKSKDLVDSYYLNYKIADIDFEAILLSSFFQKKSVNEYFKLGLTLEEFKTVSRQFFDKEKLVESRELQTAIEDFATMLEIEDRKTFQAFMKLILDHNLSSYNFDELSIDDYRHVGGIIFLAKG